MKPFNFLKKSTTDMVIIPLYQVVKTFIFLIFLLFYLRETKNPDIGLHHHKTTKKEVLGAQELPECCGLLE
ncbi:hypothetical protein N780_02280 [Pontibacillus chungwhensis BH030062]|uniref:Uncharacterized protein n=1 Tax=Pontibacillus chungwhensis BH030062 TaxID=1385513 RepID=A0A0A2USQ6_9BACI|nr:hypothetical protein N780_02280 [Pontibacillus chungwhensis BH030062]